MDLALRARAQAGVFTRTQARQSGLSDDQIDRKLAAGQWRALFPGVLMADTTPLTRRGEVWATVLAAGPGAAVSHRTAAALWGWTDDLGPVHISVGNGRPRLSARAVVHRSPLTPGEVTQQGRLPLTTPLRTLTDCLRTLPRSHAAEVLDRSQQRGGPPLPAVAAAMPRRAPGCLQARELLAAADGTLFEAERRVARILRAAGIDGWRANHPVTVGGRRYVIDFAFPGSMVAIEVDGFAHHSDVTRFQRDRQRQNDLVRAGWTVLRFTWADVTERPHDVVARVRTELARLQDGLPRYAR